MSNLTLSASPPSGEFLFYQTEDGRTRLQVRMEEETVWLTQKLMADLFQIGVNTVNHHLKAIFTEGELPPQATIRRYRIVQTEGSRQITREVEHYNLQAILFSKPTVGNCWITPVKFLPRLPRPRPRWNTIVITPFLIPILVRWMWILRRQ